MKTQLTLTFGETLAYSSETFVAHSGVREIAETLVTLAAERRFALVYIHGLNNSGKTHLSVYCAGLLQSLGRSVDVLAPDAANEWFIRSQPRKRSKPNSSLFIDDAERWIVSRDAEGGFTAVADAVLQAQGLLVLLSSVPAVDVHASGQIKSRLVAGVQLQIGSPEERDLDLILQAMSAQRGLKLTEPKRRFILARVTRTVPALADYMARLYKTGQQSSSSTSFEVLASAL
jgi:chromosomal replication initiation ATPase DnaA